MNNIYRFGNRQEIKLSDERRELLLRIDALLRRAIKMCPNAPLTQQGLHDLTVALDDVLEYSYQNR